MDGAGVKSDAQHPTSFEAALTTEGMVLRWVPSLVRPRGREECERMPMEPMLSLIALYWSLGLARAVNVRGLATRAVSLVVSMAGAGVGHTAGGGVPLAAG